MVCAFPSHAVQDGLQPPQIFLTQVLRQGFLGPLQLLRVGRELGQMAGCPPPLADPSVGVGRIVPEDLAGLGARRLGDGAQSGALQMILDQPLFKGNITGRCIICSRVDTERYQRQGVEQAAA